MLSKRKNGWLLYARIAPLAFWQELQMHGQVMIQDSIPIPGVTGLVTRTDVGTATASLEEFQIHTPKGHFLGGSFIRRECKELQVTGETILQVVILEGATALDEVVITCKKGVVEAEEGKTTSKVDWVATNSAITALEMLKIIPGLGVNFLYSTAELRGMYLTKNLFYTNAGIKRSFLDKKLEATISIADILNSFRMIGYAQSSITDNYYRWKPDSGRFSLYCPGAVRIFNYKSTKSEQENRV